MVILVRPVQSKNALLPIEVTLEGIVILVKLHPENAPFPIEVTLEGMFTLVRFLHQENALSPIEVTPAGIVYILSCLPAGYVAITVLFLLKRTPPTLEYALF